MYSIRNPGARWCAILRIFSEARLKFTNNRWVDSRLATHHTPGTRASQKRNLRRNLGLHRFHAFAAVLVERFFCQCSPRATLRVVDRLDIPTVVRRELRFRVLGHECSRSHSHASRRQTDRHHGNQALYPAFARGRSRHFGALYRIDSCSDPLWNSQANHSARSSKVISRTA